MEAIAQTSTQQVLNHHLSAFMEADVQEILKDFTDESELLTPEGALKGLPAIQSFFEEAFKVIPKGSSLDLKQMAIRDDVAFIAWRCESPFVNVPLGTDTFIIREDKIVCQTLSAYMIPKQN